MLLKNLQDVAKLKKDLKISNFYNHIPQNSYNNNRIKEIRQKFYRNKNILINISFKEHYMCGYIEKIIKINDVKNK